MSPDEIVDQYPTITLADVHAALAYYWDHREDIERGRRRKEFAGEGLIQRDMIMEQKDKANYSGLALSMPDACRHMSKIT